MVLNMATSLRGFLAIFDLAQILNLVWISFQTRYVSRHIFLHLLRSHGYDQRAWTHSSRLSRIYAATRVSIRDLFVCIPLIIEVADPLTFCLFQVLLS